MKNFSQIETVCSICYVNTNDFTLQCGDLFCRDCLSSYLTFKIADGQVFELFCPLCSSLILNHEIKSLISTETYSNYEYFFTIRNLLKNKNVRLCPEPDCKGFDLVSATNIKLTCRVCKKRYCFECSQPWHEKPCKNIEDPKFLSWGRRENMKNCPRCRCFILTVSNVLNATYSGVGHVQKK